MSLRTFHCIHCETKIQVPANLPPTTAPCPKCGVSITSPGPVGSTIGEGIEPIPSVAPIPEPAQLPDPEPVSVPEVAPIPDVEPVVRLEKKQIQLEAIQKSADSVFADEAEAEAEAEPEAEAEADLPEKVEVGRVRRLLSVFVAAAAIVILLSVVVLIFKGAKKDKPSVARTTIQDIEKPPKLTREERLENEYRTKGWLAEGEAVLEQFLTSESPEEAAKLTLLGSENASEIASIRLRNRENGREVAVGSFSPVPLLKGDVDRGLFLLCYNRPPQFTLQTYFRPVVPPRVRSGLESPSLLLSSESSLFNFVDESVRIFAYFKKTQEGLKLDWKTFAQTKYRLLNEFLQDPKGGREGVFRVVLSEDVNVLLDERAGYSVYRVSDMANPKDFAHVMVSDVSPIGEALAPLKWRERVVINSQFPIQSATVRLSWSVGTQPELQLDELICSEFLGLGGVAGQWKIFNDGK